MSHRVMGQMSLAEGLVKRRGGQNQALERMGRALEWQRLERELSEIYSAAEGRPAYPPLLMFRCLLLQQWYRLSDAELEEALADRLSFRRFAGLALDQEVPDHSTVCRFRAQLAARRLGERLFAEVNRQFEAQGLLLKRGSLIDASLVRASVRPPRTEQSVPGEGSPLDPDADWTKRGRTSFYGYKAHLGMDQGSELIRAATLTSAKVNDTMVAEQLISWDEQAVYADKAYQDERRSARLVRRGIADGIMRRLMPYSRIPRSLLAARNRMLGPIRCAVERKFAIMKVHYGYARVRYRGLLKNRLQLLLMCMAMNLKRADVLVARR
jgi:transposase, IS5 family